MEFDEQLELLLADLGVAMERPGQEEEDSSPAEVTIFQADREQRGVFYRLDLIGHAPQLRVMVPAHRGPVKVEQYLVRLNGCVPACGRASVPGSVSRKSRL